MKGVDIKKPIISLNLSKNYVDDPTNKNKFDKAVKFINRHSPTTLIELIHVSDFLAIKGLVELASAQIVLLLKNMTSFEDISNISR